MSGNYQIVKFIHRWLWRLFPQRKQFLEFQITFCTCTFNKQHILISQCSSMRNYLIRSISNYTQIILYLVRVQINTERDFKNKKKFDEHFSRGYPQSLFMLILFPFLYWDNFLRYGIKSNAKFRNILP